MERLKHIEAVLFDLGGTLVDFPVPSLPVMASQCARAMYGFLVRPASELPPRAASVPGPQEAHARRRRLPSGAPLVHRALMALRRMVRSLSGLTLPRLGEACTRPLVAEGRIFEDTLGCLQALRQRGYRLGLISNTPWGTPDYLWVSQLERFALAPLFEAACFSSDVGFRKPDPRIFRAALGRMAVPADRSLFVGDDPRADIVGAQAVGLRTALITRPGRAPAPDSLAPDLCIETLSTLLDHLPPRKNG